MFSWALHLKRGPGLCDNAAAVAVEHKVYCFTNWVNGQIDVHVFNTVTLHWRKVTVTPGTGEHRSGYTAVLIEDIIYIWGGNDLKNKKYVSVLCAFDVDTHRWFEPRCSGTVPKARSLHSACGLGKVIFIHGGWTQTGRTNDMHKLDTTTMVWSLIKTRGSKPHTAINHSATIIGTKMFVSWGWAYGQMYPYNDIRVFDTETNKWLNIDTSAQLHPEGRLDHSAFAYNGELYIFGGRNVDQTFSDLWKFNPDTLSWKKVEPKGKGPSKMYGMCCCMVGDRVILFRGLETPKDLYILDLDPRLPNLKTLCKQAVIQYSLEQSELPYNLKWELAPFKDNVCN